MGTHPIISHEHHATPVLPFETRTFALLTACTAAGQTVQAFTDVLCHLARYLGSSGQSRARGGCSIIANSVYIEDRFAVWSRRVEVRRDA